MLYLNAEEDDCIDFNVVYDARIGLRRGEF